jgi:hypothetical protein
LANSWRISAVLIQVPAGDGRVSLELTDCRTKLVMRQQDLMLHVSEQGKSSMRQPTVEEREETVPNGGSRENILRLIDD